MGDCKEWDSVDSDCYETEADGPLLLKLKMKRKKPQQPSVGTHDADDHTTMDISRVQVVEEKEKLKNEATSTALADSEEAIEDKESEDGQIAAREEERGSLRVAREEELVRRLERLELEVRSQRARYSAGVDAGTGRGLDEGRRPSMSLSDGSRRDEEFRDRARAVM